ncbi:MAG: trp operon repressor [Spirochaetes bacterium]|nr:trp operon repressor [Spirochaetota bacterium]
MNKLKEISIILSEIDDEALIFKFFNSILTKNEVKNISLRWELVKLLDKGVSQRKIVKELNVSLCKITRGSKELKKKNSALKKIIHNKSI